MPARSACSPAICSRSTFWLRFAALQIWSVALLLLSLLPGITTPSGLFSWDKFNHCAAYAVLAVLLGRFLAVWRGSGRAPLISTGLGAFLFGMLVEALQWLMQVGRTAEWGDIASNALGVLIACVIFSHMERRSLQHRDNCSNHDR